MRSPLFAGNRLRVATVLVEHESEPQTVRKDTLTPDVATTLTALNSCNRCRTGHTGWNWKATLMVTGMLTSRIGGLHHEAHKCIHRVTLIGWCDCCTSPDGITTTGTIAKTEPTGATWVSSIETIANTTGKRAETRTTTGSGATIIRTTTITGRGGAGKGVAQRAVPDEPRGTR